VKYFDEMLPSEIEELLRMDDELDKAYADFQVEQAQTAEDAEELETEMDLYRYWRP